MSEERVNYASPVIVETVAAGESGSVKTTFDAVVGGFKISEKDEKGNHVVKEYTYKIDGVYTNELKAGKVAYKSAEEFQMDHVPAAKIPSIGPKMERIALVAEPRRIAVRYDQITAFQAKTDYGF